MQFNKNMLHGLCFVWPQFPQVMCIKLICPIFATVSSQHFFGYKVPRLLVTARVLPVKPRFLLLTTIIPWSFVKLSLPALLLGQMPMLTGEISMFHTFPIDFPRDFPWKKKYKNISSTHIFPVVSPHFPRGFPVVSSWFPPWLHLAGPPGAIAVGKGRRQAAEVQVAERRAAAGGGQGLQ